MSLKRDLNIPIVWVCRRCGLEARSKSIKLGPLTQTSTFHHDHCDCCGLEAAVTNIRDFGYPDFSQVQV